MRQTIISGIFLFECDKKKKNLHHLAIAMRLGKHISPGHKRTLRCRIIRRLKNMYHALRHMFLHTSMFYAQPSAPVAKDSNWMSIHNYQPHAAPYDFLVSTHTYIDTMNNGALTHYVHTHNINLHRTSCRWKSAIKRIICEHKKYNENSHRSLNECNLLIRISLTKTMLFMISRQSLMCMLIVSAKHASFGSSKCRSIMPT